jgi:hypothetical protein
MCVDIPGQPYRIVLGRQRARNGSLIETYTYGLGKAVCKTRNGEHTSPNNFTWPIGRTVYDPNAVIGSHTRSLHFFPSLEPVNALNSYDSHWLVVLPAPHLWDTPIEGSFHLPRCWHSSGASTLFCVACFGYKPDDLKILSSDKTSRNRECDLIYHRRQMMTSCLPFPEAQYGTGKKS